MTEKQQNLLRGLEPHEGSPPGEPSDAENSGAQENSDAENSDAQEKRGGDEPSEDLMQLRFTGSAKHFFRIWIVNVALTLLTLGIYSAWAKVRTQRYIYSNTLLDGTPFEYRANPLPILKGRLIALGLIVSFYASVLFAPAFVLPLLLSAVFALPWFMLASAAFTARSSAYRNMTFEFSGSYVRAGSALFGGAIVTVLTLGLGFPWARHRLTRFLISNLRFGGQRAQFRANWERFFGIYLHTYGVVALVGAAYGLIVSVFGVEVAAPLSVLLYLAYFLCFAMLRAQLFNLIWNKTQLGPVRFESSVVPHKLLILYATNTLAIGLSVGLLIPWAWMRTQRYRIECLRVYCAPDELSDFRGTAPREVCAVAGELGAAFNLEVSL